MTDRKGHADPLILDLFCGAGGCSVGYSRAGFAPRGVDIIEHPDYPFPFHQGEAVDVLKRLNNGEAIPFTHPNGTVEALRGGNFTAGHGSPPCPRYSSMTAEHNRDKHPDLLHPTIDEFTRGGWIWVVENVPGAPMPPDLTVMICGRAMGLRWFKRHRLFASSVHLMSPGCACGRERPFMVTGDHADRKEYMRPSTGTPRGRKATSVEHAREIMGIDWMSSWDDLADAIPPAYCEFVGEQVLASLRVSA